MRNLASIWLACTVALFTLPQAVQAQSARELFQTGNDHSVMGEPVPALIAYEQAAALGLAEAAHMAAQSYHYGWAGIRNFRKAAGYYDQVIAAADSEYKVREARTQREGMLRELERLARDAAIKRDLTTAERYYNLGVDLGDGDAMSGLADLYETGRHGWPRDEARARALYERQAEQDPGSYGYWMLGLMYKEGRGGPVDFPRAAAAFQAMVDMGSVSGHMELAKLYLEGKGVPRNRDIALELLQRPCDTGVREACDLGGLTPAQIGPAPAPL
jgi:TPR repeat protein